VAGSRFVSWRHKQYKAVCRETKNYNTHVLLKPFPSTTLCPESFLHLFVTGTLRPRTVLEKRGYEAVDWLACLGEVDKGRQVLFEPHTLSSAGAAGSPRRCGARRGPRGGCGCGTLLTGTDREAQALGSF